MITELKGLPQSVIKALIRRDKGMRFPLEKDIIRRFQSHSFDQL